MSRTFEHFPKDDVCPICGTNDDNECFLLPIDDTEDGNICQAQPAHVQCMAVNNFRINKKVGIIYYNLTQ